MKHFLLALAAIAFLPSLAHAEGWFAHRTLKIYTNVPATATPGEEAQILLRCIEPHIPDYVPPLGVPNHPEYIPGGNYVKSLGGMLTQPHDGSVVGYMVHVIEGAAYGNPDLPADPYRFKYLGVTGRTTVSFVKGVKSPEELIGLKRQLYYAITSGSPLYAGDVTERLGLKVMGVAFTTSTGYQTSNFVFQSILTGESNFYALTTSVYEAGVRDGARVRDEKFTPLWTTPAAPRSSVPHFDEVYRRLRGKDPSGPLYDAYRETDRLNSQFGTQVFLFADTPPEAVSILRKAFAETINSECYREGMLNNRGEVPTFVLGEQADRLVNEQAHISDGVRKTILGYVDHPNE